MTRSLPRWRSKRFAIIVLALFILVGFWGIRHAGLALVVTKDVGPPDAIVMLASHEWERLPAAAELARRYPSSVVLLTIPATVSRLNCHLCSERSQWLQRQGVRADHIIELAPNSMASTYGEALAVRTYAAAHPIAKLTVVTSPYHCRRALHVFQHVMDGTHIDVGALPASAYSLADPARWWRHPYDRWYVTYEWAANLEYRVRYGIDMTNR